MKQKIKYYIQKSLQYLISVVKCVNWRKTAIITLSGLLGLILLLFIFRQPIVKALLNHKINKFNETYQADLHIGEFSFKGISGAEIKEITLKSLNTEDTLLKIGSVYARVNFWDLLIFKVNLTDLKLEHALFYLHKEDSTDNFSFLYKKPHTPSDTDTEQSFTNETDYAAAVRRLLNTFFYRIPSNIEINDFNINSNTDGHLIFTKLPSLIVKNHQFTTFIEITENNKTMRWITEGVIAPAEKQVDIKIYAGKNTRLKLPFTEFKWKGLLAFDTISFSFNGNEQQNGKTLMKGEASVNGLLINQARISTTDVFLNNASIAYQLNVGEDYFELDSNSTVVFNKLEFHPYLYFRPSPSRQVALRLHKPRFPAKDLFESLPKGLFSNLEGLQTRGELAYNLDFFVDIDHPDSIIFESDLKRFNFGIVKYGNSNLSKMNEDFLYTAFEKGEAVRSFVIGPENTNFRRLDEISPYLKNAVLTSEDGAFFWHRGFLSESFKESITKDIKTKKFARGGSTISMQLVKNVFLNRNKTIARKLEEALIVWLIENNGLTSKERMFEVYLNIIEWGPGVYGANEASRFYFNKDASKLSLAEALYLTSMIPHPKWFTYSFDKSGMLKPFLADYYAFVSNRMLKKEMITQDDFDKLKPQIEIKGPAKNLIIRTDSVPIATDLLTE
jgi:hypothetical protein